MKKLKKIILFFAFSLCCNAFGADVAKKDGSVDQRPDDLTELCRDWVYYRAQIMVRARAGDQQGAAKARLAFQRTNQWLSEYKQSDVAPCIQKAEDEYIKKH